MLTIVSSVAATLFLALFMAVFGAMAGRLDKEARFALRVLGGGSLVFVVLLLVAGLFSLPMLVSVAIPVAGLVVGYLFGWATHLSR